MIKRMAHIGDQERAAALLTPVGDKTPEMGIQRGLFGGESSSGPQTQSTQPKTPEMGIPFKLPPGHVLIPWLIRHVPWCQDRFQIKKNGKTPYFSMRGKSYNGFTVNFGERCQFRILTDDKYEDRWLPGVFVGKQIETDEFIALTEKGVMLSRSCKRYASKVDAYDLDYLSKIKGLPWAPLGDMVEGAVKMGKDFMVGGASIRRMYITEQMLKEHGRTDGCPRCENYGATHSEECRRRLESKMTAAGQAFDPQPKTGETQILVEEPKASLPSSSSSVPISSNPGSSSGDIPSPHLDSRNGDQQRQSGRPA